MLDDLCRQISQKERREQVFLDSIENCHNIKQSKKKPIDDDEKTTTTTKHFHFLSFHVTCEQLAKDIELKTAVKHFETIDQFWGRPGHGAAKKIKTKLNLSDLLYQMYL